MSKIRPIFRVNVNVAVNVANLARAPQRFRTQGGAERVVRMAARSKR
jgi:hypothetical protein